MKTCVTDIPDAELYGNVVLVRVDFDVPMDDSGTYFLKIVFSHMSLIESTIFLPSCFFL